ncbi:hypothetical protein N7508_002365 [Penicillium antarcticum]|uniref:uncharacterized protein n=1 Tax=Penicillium antarcticum TaxID=416450 RepID=UPI00239FCCB9|nr:uncharacterized protein N7508_002365 [Penicillium antarcticum]KAJ5317857.1 hypothetical protein N7508_002365 [Penicillium antarcticum]
MAGLLLLGTGALVTYFMAKSIYRLYFHPLSKIPGPRLAAISTIYEFYFNVIKQGSFIWEMERLHKDSNYYDEIYASGKRRREKDAILVAQFDLKGSAFSSVTPEEHRQKRSNLEKHFSKQSVTNMEHLIHENIDKLDQHFKRAYESHKAVTLDAGFAGLTSDVIHKYAYGINSGNLDHEEFNEKVRDGINGLFKFGHISYFFPIIQTVMKSLPLEWLEKIDPFVYALRISKENVTHQTKEFLGGKSSNSKPRPIMEIITGSDMPEHLRQLEGLSNDGFSLVLGGTETTARALTIAAFRLISNENMRKKLREELRTVMPTPDSRPTWSQLEQLPYLSGVVSEALRLSTGIASRSPRIAPTEALLYKDYTIPPGTRVSQTNYFVLTDPEIFPDPHAFDPDRWLRAAAKGERLDRFMVQFSKGTRNCLGMNLAYAELFLVLAAFVRRFDMELFETTEKQIAFVRDFGTPYPDEGNTTVRATVTGVIKE